MDRTIEGGMTTPFQTTPILASRPAECRLMTALRRAPYDACLYSCPAPTVMDTLPEGGTLVVNGDEVEEAPVVIEGGDLVVWLPHVGDVS